MPKRPNPIEKSASRAMKLTPLSEGPRGVSRPIKMTPLLEAPRDGTGTSIPKKPTKPSKGEVSLGRFGAHVGASTVAGGAIGSLFGPLGTAIGAQAGMYSGIVSAVPAWKQTENEHKIAALKPQIEMRKVVNRALRARAAKNPK